MMLSTSTRTTFGVRADSMRRIGDVFACGSLVCSLSFWLWFALGYLVKAVRNLTGLHWLGIMTVGLVLASFAVACRSKLRAVAFPVALVMWLLVMYIMGT